MSDTNNGNSTKNTNSSTTQVEVNRSGYDWLMKSAGAEPVAQMRTISEGFSFHGDTENTNGD